MNKLNTKGIAHFLIPLMVVVIGVAAAGTYMLVGSHAASNGCSVKPSHQGRLGDNGGNTWGAVAVMHLKCSSSRYGLAANTVSFCDIASRSNPREHGKCYGAKKAYPTGGGTYTLVSNDFKGNTPSSAKMVIITDPGDRPHYDFMIFRR